MTRVYLNEEYIKSCPSTPNAGIKNTKIKNQKAVWLLVFFFSTGEINFKDRVKPHEGELSLGYNVNT